MKKIFIAYFLCSLLGLAACSTGTSDSVSTKESTTRTSLTSESTLSSSSSTNESIAETTTGTIPSQSSVTQNTQIQSSDIATDSNTQANADGTLSMEDQALEMLYAARPEMKNDDYTFAFFGMVGADYLFRGTSISIRNQGGSGTIGFFRVTPEGAVIDTDSSGNPY
ncbi:hypothetical protein DW084_02620 [Enterococcus casseliflavus]|uniref:Lipoprotein n=1 Tax=Enterococcus casseliflavus TaxID=37734 RepID=A0A415EWA7_ENTCA|nr:hypothetical protein DW084_02620 [Enterococcus casseliflavus]